MKVLMSLIRKDIVLEYRSRETIALLVGLSVLLSTMAAFGITGAFLPPVMVSKVYPTMLWIIIVFVATLALGRTYFYELEHDALEGLLLSGVSPVLLYCSKTLVSFSMIFPTSILVASMLGIGLQVPLLPVLGDLVLILGLVTLGYTALTTLIAAIAANSRLKGLLLPLLVLPLLFPLLFAALELTSSLLAQGELAVGSWWLSLLVILDVLYVLAGVNFFEFVVRD